MPKTISEELFEEFCRINGIKFQRVPETVTKTHDYDIYPNGLKVVTEVKQIEPNPDELKSIEKCKEGEVAICETRPGQRVRKLISKACPQIKSNPNGGLPSIIIIYDNVIIGSHTDPYMIRVAMYGLETYVYGVPTDLRVAPFLKDAKFGPKRKMTEEHNTSISAVAVMMKPSDDRIELRVYHNIHTAIPLDPDIMRFRDTYHFTLGEKNQGSLRDWVGI